jgi:hypothetical protein
LKSERKRQRHCNIANAQKEKEAMAVALIGRSVRKAARLFLTLLSYQIRE